MVAASPGRTQGRDAAAVAQAVAAGIGDRIPARAGVGLRPAHYRDILEHPPEIGWFEIHPENYMGAGGPPHRYLSAIRERYPISMHGVGLSLGGAGELDGVQLTRLAGLVSRYRPALVSEHLAWSAGPGGYLNDLLPIPYSEATLRQVTRHVVQMQEALGCRVLIENPSVYLGLDSSELDETQFLEELARDSGCGLLLDVNNVFVSATNLGFDPITYLDEFPMHRVGEIHVAGHSERIGAGGSRLLIDSHDRPVAPEVWDLLDRTLECSGPQPVLVEWDSSIPEWPLLMQEARRAQRCIDRTRIREEDVRGVPA